MIGLGTLINVGGILLGGLLGALFGKAINVRIQETLMKATGLCVIFLGISGAIEKMMTVTETGLTSGGTMMIIGSFAIGSLIGEIWNIEKHLEHFGEWLKEKTKNDRDTKFVDGFVNTSLTVCIGAMAVVGAIQDGRHDHRHHHDHIHGERLHFLCHSCGTLSGMHHHTVPFHRALDDRTGIGQPVPHRLHAHFLCRCQSDLGEKVQSCQYASHHRHCSHLGTASFWGITEYTKRVKYQDFTRFFYWKNRLF